LYMKARLQTGLKFSKSTSIKARFF
jgi:hypothetical protein